MSVKMRDLQRVQIDHCEWSVTWSVIFTAIISLIIETSLLGSVGASCSACGLQDLQFYFASIKQEEPPGNNASFNIYYESHKWLCRCSYVDREFVIIKIIIIIIVRAMYCHMCRNCGRNNCRSESVVLILWTNRGRKQRQRKTNTSFIRWVYSAF